MQVLKETSFDPQPEQDKRPAHQHVYENLRDRILFGDLIPGQAVTLQGLVAALDAGMTPVREAVRRLIAEGALSLQENRRVSVPVLSAACVEQLEYMRISLETELAVRALPNMTPDRIAELESLDNALNQAISNGDIAGYLTFNYRFHQRLYAVAEAGILAETVDRLWLRFGPSLRVVCGRYGTLNLPDCHVDLLSALSEKNIEATRQALTSDIRQGMTQMHAACPAQPQET